MPTPGSARPTTAASTTKALDAALEHAGYDDAARRAGGAPRARRHEAARHRRRVVPRDQRAARRSTSEYGAVEIDDDGTVTADVGTSAHGQGHETDVRDDHRATRSACRWRQVTRPALRHRPRSPRGGGTGGSRSLPDRRQRAVQVASEEVLDAGEAARRAPARGQPRRHRRRRRRRSRSRACPRAAVVGRPRDAR